MSFFEARSLAHGIACSSTPGLNLGCEPITYFHRTGPASWELRIAGPGHPLCFQLRTFHGARPHACGAN